MSETKEKLSKKETAKPLKCTIEGCNATFAKNRALTNHVRKHTGDRPFVCDEPNCDKTYTNSSHLRRHKKVFHEKVDLKVECSFEGCQKVFSNSWNMKRHYSRCHNKERFPYNCKDCEKGYKKKWQLAQHVYEHTGKMAFSCDKCDEQFAKLKELTKHKRNHKSYPCVCGRVYHRWTRFLDHRKNCVRLKPKCEICNKIFATKQNLKQHMCIHGETRNKNIYLCIYKGCSRFYFYKRNLIYHINAFHKKQLVRIPCLFLGCDTHVTKMKDLRKHMIKVHKMERRVVRKKQRKPRKDKGKPKLSTAGKLIGVCESISEEKSEENNVGEHFKDIIEVCESAREEKSKENSVQEQSKDIMEVCKSTHEEKSEESSVREQFKDIISTYYEEVCYN